LDTHQSVALMWLTVPGFDHWGHLHRELFIQRRTGGSVGGALAWLGWVLGSPLLLQGRDTVRTAEGA
jgi:hypothetical protein